MVSAGAVAPWYLTVVDHGVFSPPAGRPPVWPMGCSADGWRTCTRMLSSTPVIVPPTVTGDPAAVPYRGWVIVSVVSLLPTTSHGASAPVPNLARCSTAAVPGARFSIGYPTATSASLPWTERHAT